MNIKNWLLIAIIVLIVILALFTPRKAQEATVAYAFTPLEASTTNAIPPVATHIPLDTKTLVINEFGTSSIMVQVAKCESGFRQFDKSGNVLRGIVNHQDVGVFQINEHYHLKSAVDKSVDIYSTYGNIKYARYLYNTYGTEPWTASMECWKN